MTDKEQRIHDLAVAAASYNVANNIDGDENQIEPDDKPYEVATRICSEYDRMLKQISKIHDNYDFKF